MADMHEWITAAEAGQLLRMSARQVHRYGEGGKLRTKRAGRRVLYHQGDVQALADELQVDYRPEPPASRQDLVPAGEMLNYLREKDQQIAELHAKLEVAIRRVGQLEGQVETQKQLTAERQPWWKRWFGGQVEPRQDDQDDTARPEGEQSRTTRTAGHVLNCPFNGPVLRPPSRTRIGTT